MKETIVTLGMFDAGLIKPGQRIRTRFADTSYDGNVTRLDNEDVHIRYDDGDTAALYIPGFREDATEEEQAPSRLYILEDEALASKSPAEALYMLLDVQRCTRRQNVTLEHIQAYALTDYKELGSTEHLVAVAVADMKPVKLTVAF